MSNAMNACKEMAELLAKSKKTTDAAEKSELMNQFWQTAAPAVDEVVNEPIVPTGFVAAEQIHNFEL
jgi:hypothetical protein